MAGFLTDIVKQENREIRRFHRPTHWIRLVSSFDSSANPWMHPQPLICVNDVEASSRWYQLLLGCRSAHGGPNYERLEISGKLMLQLHRWDVDHHHGPIGDPNKLAGNGLLLWFEIEDIDAAIARANLLGAEVILPRHRNPAENDGGPNHWEIWLRDPDGYKVVLASPDGTADGTWKP
jgi:catechol 2,3-dioxygenase-like lactoylglutathione lyase family enzyme